MDEIKPVACVSKRALETLDQFDPPSILPADEYSKRTDVYLYDQQAIDTLRAEVDNLRLQLDAQESNRVRDNAYLIARAERAEAEADSLRVKSEKDWNDWIDHALEKWPGSESLLAATWTALGPPAKITQAEIDAATKEHG